VKGLRQRAEYGGRGIVATANQPKDHHYIPQFLLREWADASGFLFRYTQPAPGKIDPKKKPTKAAGFVPNLYSIVGNHPDKAQLVETLFMSPLDNEAAQAHKLILAGDWEALDIKLKSAWTTFLMSLMLRTPEALAAYKEGYKALWKTSTPEIQAKYEAMKEPGDPATYEEYALEEDPLIAEKLAMTELGKIIVNEPLGTHINNMIWGTLAVKVGSFLISDEPIIMSNGIGIEKPDAHLAIPISPSKLFVAVNTQQTFDWIASKPSKDLVRETNTLVVERARSFVAAKDNLQAKFIGNRFGKNLTEGLAHLFAKKYAGKEANPYAKPDN
jgi:hypothetical protein